MRNNLIGEYERVCEAMNQLGNEDTSVIVGTSITFDTKPSLSISAIFGGFSNAVNTEGKYY